MGFDDLFKSPRYTIEQVMDTLQNKIKIVLCGDGAVGKTCVLMGYALKSFPKKYVPTVYDSYQVEIVVEDRDCELQIVDTAGQEDYQEIRKLGYQGADVTVICFDVSNEISFRNIKETWIPEVRATENRMPVVLCATKCDLLGEEPGPGEEFVNMARARKLAKSTKSGGPVHCSAKNLMGLDELFNVAIKRVIMERQEVKLHCTLL